LKGLPVSAEITTERPNDAERGWTQRGPTAAGAFESGVIIADHVQAEIGEPVPGTMAPAPAEVRADRQPAR
jgi:hypothetical protein